jgi:hypothetical protein
MHAELRARSSTFRLLLRTPATATRHGIGRLDALTPAARTSWIPGAT